MSDIATPGPWRTNVNEFDDWVLIRGADGFPVARRRFRPGSMNRTLGIRIPSVEVEANAELIVRAVNNHEALLAACKEARYFLAATDDYHKPHALVEKLRIAIHDAEQRP